MNKPLKNKEVFYMGNSKLVASPNKAFSIKV